MSICGRSAICSSMVGQLSGRTNQCATWWVRWPGCNLEKVVKCHNFSLSQISGQAKYQRILILFTWTR